MLETDAVKTVSIKWLHFQKSKKKNYKHVFEIKAPVNTKAGETNV